MVPPPASAVLAGFVEEKGRAVPKTPSPHLTPTPKAVPLNMYVAADGTLLSEGAVDRRIRRVMEPNAKGEYKVNDTVRKMWDEGKKGELFKLFAACDNDPKQFIKKHSAKIGKEKEFELGVFFTFVTEEDMKGLPETLRLNYIAQIL